MAVYQQKAKCGEIIRGNDWRMRQHVAKCIQCRTGILLKRTNNNESHSIERQRVAVKA